MKYIFIVLVIFIFLISCSSLPPSNNPSGNGSGSGSGAIGSYVTSGAVWYNGIADGSEMTFTVNSNAQAVKFAYFITDAGKNLSYRDQYNNWRQFTNCTAANTYVDGIVIPVFNGQVKIKISASGNIQLNQRGYWKDYTFTTIGGGSVINYNPGDITTISYTGTLARIYFMNRTTEGLIFSYRFGGVWFPFVCTSAGEDTYYTIVPIEAGNIVIKTNATVAGTFNYIKEGVY
jgi:hypothetical protein